LTHAHFPIAKTWHSSWPITTSLSKHSADQALSRSTKKKIWRIVLLPAVGASLIDLHKGGRSKLDTAIFVTIDTKDIYKRFHSWFLKLIQSSYLRRIAAEESQCLLSSVAPSMLAFCFRNEGKEEEDEEKKDEESHPLCMGGT
jgi:hypothetical protein